MMRVLKAVVVTIATMIVLLALLPPSIQAQVFPRVINVTNLLAATATSYLTVRISDGTSFVTLNADATDEAAFVYATDKVTSVGFCAESTTDALTDGKIGCAVMDLLRRLRMVPTGSLNGGAVPVNMLSDGTDNDDLTAICTGPCTVYSLHTTNHAATTAFLRCENDTVGNTVPGSEANAAGEFDIEIPGQTTGAGNNRTYPVGVSFATALSCWFAIGEASSSTVDPGADDVRAEFTRVQ